MKITWYGRSAFLLEGKKKTLIDLFTMNPEHAAKAAHWIKAQVVIPMHYNTFPQIEQDPKDFKNLVETICDCEVVTCEPGKTIEV